LPIAIIGLLANKKFIPESPGHYERFSTFGAMTLAVILMLLLVLPGPLALGPLAEYFSLY
jgi:K+-transporting ATPase ATPase A chain